MRRDWFVGVDSRGSVGCIYISKDKLIGDSSQAFEYGSGQQPEGVQSIANITAVSVDQAAE